MGPVNDAIGSPGASGAPPYLGGGDGAEQGRIHAHVAAATSTLSAWGERHERALHICVTSAFLIASTSIALAVDDLGIVLSVVGATGSTTVSYILPGGTYFLLKRRGAKRWLGFLQVVLGFTIMPISLALIFLGSDAP